MKKNNITCERCGKSQSVNNAIHFGIHVPPYAYYGYNICRNCYKKFEEFMNELGRTELWTDSHSCATCKYCNKPEQKYKVQRLKRNLLLLVTVR